MFTAASGVVPHWFHKNLGLAFACMASGSSIGGTIFPIILKNLIEHQRSVLPFASMCRLFSTHLEHSFQWTLRITGFIITVFLVILNLVGDPVKAKIMFLVLTVQMRRPSHGGSRPTPIPVHSSISPCSRARHTRPIVSRYSSVSWACTQYVSRSPVTMLSIDFEIALQCLTYISLSGLTVGLDSDLSFYLLSIANASSLLGRIAGGVLADKYGECGPVGLGLVLS